MKCPACKTPLEKEMSASGITYACPTCKGRSVGMAVLRKRFEKDAVNDLWRRARAAPRRGERPCPACGLPMAEVGVHRDAREAIVDACSFCFLLWFDFDEMEALPELPPAAAAEQRSQDAVIAQAQWEMKSAQEDMIEEVDPLCRDSLPGWLGLPTKYGAPERSVVPWATYVLSGVLLALTVIPALQGLAQGIAGIGTRFHAWALAWGFIPAEPFRNGGVTSITSFFLHGGLLHVIGNVYFLLLAGEDVEGHLGRGRFLLLLLVSTLAGDALHLLLAPTSRIPTIGASGGISGLLGWYACAFPKVRVGIVVMGWRPMWLTAWYRLRIGVRWMFAFWLLLQLSGLLLPAWYGGSVAYGAHLGGAFAGVAWWFLFDRSRTARLSAGERA